MKWTKQDPIKLLHVLLQFVVIIDFAASILFIVFSDMPRKYQALQNSNYCDKTCKTMLARKYFSAVATLTFPKADSSFLLRNYDNYIIYACPGTPVESYARTLIYYPDAILDYSFYLTFGDYYFLPKHNTTLYINNESHALQAGANYSVYVSENEVKHVLVDNAYYLKVEFYTASTQNCSVAERLGERDVGFYVFRQKLYGNEQLVPAIVGEKKYLDVAYIVLLVLIVVSLLIQAEVIVFYVYSIRKSLRDSSRMAGLTQFIDSNLI